jgi:hypothetical protein
VSAFQVSPAVQARLRPYRYEKRLCEQFSLNGIMGLRSIGPRWPQVHNPVGSINDSLRSAW